MTKRDPFDWTETHLLSALYWARRSHDPSTQCGCVLVTPDNTPISSGYNGFPRDINDSDMPTGRKIDPVWGGDKYHFMVHSEQNAIYNACRQGKCTLNAIGYVTGPPCTTCLIAMYQAGLQRVVYTDFNIIKSLKKDKWYLRRFSKLAKAFSHNMEVIHVPIEDISGDHLYDTIEAFETALEKAGVKFDT